MLKKRSSRRLVIPLGIKVRAAICNGNFSRFHESTADKFELRPWPARRGSRSPAIASAAILSNPLLGVMQRGGETERNIERENERRVIFAVLIDRDGAHTTIQLADAKLEARGTNRSEK